MNGLAASHTRQTESARHDRCMGGRPTVLCEDALGFQHAVHIVRTCLRSNEHDGLTLRAARGGRVSIEHGLAYRRTWRRIEPTSDEAPLRARLLFGRFVEA